MSKVIRLSDAQQQKLEDYCQLRLSALRLYYDAGSMSDRDYLDARFKLCEMKQLELLSDALSYAVNSLKYDIESLSAPDPEEIDIVQRVVQMQDAIPDK